MAGNDKLPSKSARNEIDEFLQKVATAPVVKAAGERGRLIFGMDATASRQPSWDRASHIQAEMFKETAALGGLEIQLAYYRGFGEFTASPWIRDSDKLLARMTRVFCLAGRTQVGKLLKHAVRETKRRKVNALVFVGDCFEEDIDAAGQTAGEMGLLGLPCFMFHEGGDLAARNAFQQIAKLSGGAFCPFDANSPQQLKDLLAAVAVYAAGGRRALTDFSGKKGSVVKQLTHQMK